MALIRKQQQEKQKEYLQHAKYNSIFNTDQQGDLKRMYGQSLQRQIDEHQKQKYDNQYMDSLMNRQVVEQQINNSPFGRDRVRHLQYINQQMSKQLPQVDDFLKNNQDRPKTRYVDMPYSDRQQQQYIHPNEYESNTNRNYSEVPATITMTNQSYYKSQAPPKTPGTVYDGMNNPVVSDYVSVYDQQYSHRLKQEKSNLAKDLNNINSQYLKQLLEQMQKNKQPPPKPMPMPIQQQPPQYTYSPKPTQQSDYEKQQQLLLQQQQDAQAAELLRKQQREENERQMRERIERELREELRLKQLEMQTQTEVETQNTGIQHVDHNAVSASEYMNTLKTLSGSVIDMKNQFVYEQGKLNQQLIQIKQNNQRDLEEKLKLQQEIRDLEHKHKMFCLWEDEQQKQLGQALAKNAPVPKLKSHLLDYSKLNPTVTKVTRFRDDTRGYEYDEPNNVLTKSNLMPIGYMHNSNNQNALQKLKTEVPLTPEELEQTKSQQVPQLNYSNGITRQLRLDDFNQQFYDYKYPRQAEQPIAEQYESSRYNQHNNQDDPDRILLENDRRLHELNIIDPHSDRQQIQELYKYL